jgi:hypothetical protein
MIKPETARGVNIRYKDSVFSFLFSDPDVLRELYGALEGIALDPSAPITINTLKGVFIPQRTFGSRARNTEKGE